MGPKIYLFHLNINAVPRVSLGNLGQISCDPNKLNPIIFIKFFWQNIHE